jgi:hypothetical protein
VAAEAELTLLLVEVLEDIEPVPEPLDVALLQNLH